MKWDKIFLFKQKGGISNANVFYEDIISIAAEDK